MSRPYRKQPSSDAVPAFVFYGEEAKDAEIGAFHIEPLHRRSALHGWKIAPHLHKGLLQIFVITGGRATVSVEGRFFEVAAPVVLTIPTGVPHGLQYEPGAQGHVLTLRDAPPPGVEPRAGRQLMETLFAAPLAIELDGEDDTATRLYGLLDQLYAERGRAAGTASPLLESLLVSAALALMVRLYERARREAPRLPARTSQLRAFEALVERHYTDHLPVGRYAQMLNMSESTLDRLCRSFTGRTAFQVVQGRLAQEARRRLVYSNAPVQRVAEELGFAGQAYFSRFMRRQTGLAPKAFRRQARQAVFASPSGEES